MFGQAQIVEAVGIMAVIVIMLGCGLAIIVNRMRTDDNAGAE